MSAGRFTTSRYEADYDDLIHPIRVQPETLALTIATVANAPPAGAVTNRIRAKVGKGKREIGLGARMVTVAFTGTVPDGYSGDPIRLPVLSRALADVIVGGATGTYLGAPIVVVGEMSAEDVN